MVGIFDANPLNLRVHNNTYTESRPLSGYAALELSEETGLNAGGGQITLPAAHPLARRIMQASADVVPVTASRNGWSWTGRVDDYTAAGAPGREMLTANLVSDIKQLSDVCGWPSTRTPLVVQGKQDHQMGRLLNVVLHYISENVARTGLPAYIQTPPRPADDKSPIVDVASRMTPLDSLLRDITDEHDYNIRAYMWWPGEPFPEGKFTAMPDGLSTTERFRRVTHADLDMTFTGFNGKRLWEPTTPGLVVEVKPVRERPHVRFSTNGRDVQSVSLHGRSPGAVTQIAGGKSDDWVNELIGFGVDSAVQGILAAVGAAAGSILGPAGMAIGAVIGGGIGAIAKDQMSDTMFAFVSRTDVERQASMGPHHPREAFTSSGAGAFTFDTNALAERALLDAKGGQTIEVTLADGVSKVLGEDEQTAFGKVRHGWVPGDRVTIEEHLSGVVISDIITGVSITDEPDKRLRVTPRVGKRKNVTNPYLKMTERMKRTGEILSDLGLSG